MPRIRTQGIPVGLLSLVALCASCGDNASFFNPGFLNQLQGGVYPATPGPGAAFVLVRVHNDTDEVADFIVTIERRVLVEDDEGNAQYDDEGELLTREEMETVRLRTFPLTPANDTGVLFPCSESPVIRVGLGENLLPGDAAAFVIEGYDASSAVQTGGFGVAAEGLNPLALEDGNFNCGDTIIFQAFTSSGTGSAGNVKFRAWLQPGSEQPSIFSGPDTFANYAAFLESQVREDEP